MTNKSILALVVSSSGSLQNGLLALATTFPGINAVLVAEDADSTLRMIENHHPALIILDLSLSQVKDLIKEIRAQWPRIQLIVIVEDTAEQKEAEELGVCRVLLKGFSTQKFITMVDEIIDRLEDIPLVQANTEGEANND
jgi:DNA-binding NarL/FixJ family response regulator